MRIRIIALAAAAASVPAGAQIVVGGQTGVGANVSVDAGRTVGGVTSTLDRTVERTDRGVNRAADRTVERDVGVVAAADVRAGAIIRDQRGRRIGTVQEVHGDTVLVVNNDRQVHVPLASLYRSGSALVSRLSRAELGAEASADARAEARDNR